MRILICIATFLLASGASSATEPDLAKLAGARAGEHVRNSYPVTYYGPGVWVVELASAPSMRHGWCTTQSRSVYASDHAIAELQFPFPATEDSLVAFADVSAAECKGEPKGAKLFVDEVSLPYLSEARALLDHAMLDRFAGVSHCSRYFPGGTAGLSFEMRGASLYRGMVEAIFFHDGIQLGVLFPITDGKLDLSAAKSSCTRMSDIVN